MFKTKPRKRIALSSSAPKELLEVPNLLTLQLESYEKFIREGLKDEFRNISPVIGYGGKFELEFLDDYSLEEQEFKREFFKIIFNVMISKKNRL